MPIPLVIFFFIEVRIDQGTWLHLLKTKMKTHPQKIQLFLLGFDSSSNGYTLTSYWACSDVWTLFAMEDGVGYSEQFFPPWLEGISLKFLRVQGWQSGEQWDCIQPWVRLWSFGPLTIHADGFYFHLCDRLTILYMKYLEPKMFWISPPCFGKFAVHNTILETGVKSKHEVDLCSYMPSAPRLMVTLYAIYSKTQFHWNR